MDKKQIKVLMIDTDEAKRIESVMKLLSEKGIHVVTDNVIKPIKPELDIPIHIEKLLPEPNNRATRRKNKRKKKH